MIQAPLRVCAAARLRRRNTRIAADLHILRTLAKSSSRIAINHTGLSANRTVNRLPRADTFRTCIRRGARIPIVTCVGIIFIQTRGCSIGCGRVTCVICTNITVVTLYRCTADTLKIDTALNPRTYVIIVAIRIGNTLTSTRRDTLRPASDLTRRALALTTQR